MKRGDRVGRWTVTSHGGGKVVQCTCDCGTVAEVLVSNLKSGRTQSCGCRRHWPTGNYPVQRGKVYGMMLALQRVGSTWKCECTCGATHWITTSFLSYGAPQSCDHCGGSWQEFPLVGMRPARQVAAIKGVTPESLF